MRSASDMLRLIYFTITKFIGGGLYFYFITLIFQYLMFFVIYCILNESQRDPRMTSVLYHTKVLQFVLRMTPKSRAKVCAQ